MPSTFAGVALTLSFLAASAARAEDPVPCPPPEGGVHARVDPYFERAFDADLDGDRGQLGLVRAGVDALVTVPVSRPLKFHMAARVERDDYEFSDSQRVVAGTGDLPGDALLVRVGVAATVTASPYFGVTVGAFSTTAGAPGARFEDTLTYGALASLRVGLRDDFAVVLGASVETTLEGSARLGPIVDLEGTSSGRFGLEAWLDEVRATYRFSPAFKAGVAGRWERRDFRLAEDDRVPSGVFRDFRASVGLHASWKPSESVSVQGTLWLDAYQEVRVDDRDGDEVTRFEAEPSPALELSVTLRF